MSGVIARFCRDRDDALLTGDVRRVMGFAWKYDQLVPCTIEAAEVAMHQAITAVVDLPVEYRRASMAWLAARGHRSLDDGEF
jgi:hypothetical protein